MKGVKESEEAQDPVTFNQETESTPPVRKMERYIADTEDYRTSTVRDLLSLSGKTVVVTGGARGLGLSIAVGCAELGGTVVILDILDEPTEALKTLATENGLKDIHYYKADVTDVPGLTAIFDRIKQTHGSIACLVNGAGVAAPGPFTECDPATVSRLLRINIEGTIFPSQLAIEQMRASGREGAIVNIASIGAHGHVPGQEHAVYCASKGAVIALTKALAVEHAPQNIRVNCVSPGYFLTNMTPGYRQQDLSKLRYFESQTPLGRFADRSELKSVVAFLLSPASSYITGEDILVDGGVRAG